MITRYQEWKNQLGTEPVAWMCDVLWGGNRYALERFQMPGFEGYLLSVPSAASQAGGDIHYITVCDRGVFSKFLLLDVAGHGESAAPISRRLQKPLLQHMKELDNRAILTTLNETILREEEAGSFATAAAATYNHWDRSWTYAYAGHPNMLVRRNGRWGELPDGGAASLPVGILSGTRYLQNCVDLDEGQWILMFSDQLLETRDSRGEQLGFGGVIALLNAIDHQEVGAFYQALARGLVAVNGSEQFNDDLTIILLKHQALPDQAIARFTSRVLQSLRKGMMTLVKRARAH